MLKEIVVFIGLVLCVLGLGGIVSIGFISLKIRKKQTQSSFDIKKSKSIFKNLIVINYVSLLTSFLGLLVVIIGLTIY